MIMHMHFAMTCTEFPKAENISILAQLAYSLDMSHI